MDQDCKVWMCGCMDVWMCRFRGHIAHASPKICNMPNTLENISPVTWVWCSHKFQFQRSSSQHLFGKSCVKGDKAVLCSGDVSLQQISARHNWEKSDPMSHPWLYNVCHQLLSTRAMAFLQRTTPNFAQFAKRSPDCVCNMVRFHQLLKNVLLSPAFEAISKSPVFWYYHCRAWGKNKPRLMVDQWKKSRSNNIKTQQTQRLEVEKNELQNPSFLRESPKKVTIGPPIWSAIRVPFIFLTIFVPLKKSKGTFEHPFLTLEIALASQKTLELEIIGASNHEFLLFT